MLKSENKSTTWWQPQSNVIIDARDISGVSVKTEQYFNPDGTASIIGLRYTLIINFSNKSNADSLTFTYDSIEKLNAVLAPLELSWIPDEEKG